MKRIFYCMLAVVLLLASAFIGYGVYLNKTGDSNITARMADSKLHLRCAVAKVRDVKPSYRLNNVELQTGDTTDTVSRTEGTIVESFVTHKNQVVKAGDPLFRIVNTKLPLEKAKALNALARVQAQAEQAELSFHRYEKLVELNATSTEKYDEARANYKATAAAVQEAQAQVDMVNVMQEESIVKASSNGHVMLIYKRVGDYVQNGTPLCFIGDFSNMWFSSNMPDSRVRALLEGADKNTDYVATFARSNTSKVYETEYSAGNKGKDQLFPLKLYGIFPSMDKPADMRRVVWHIDNSAAVLEPRAYNNVFIYSDNPRRMFVIPRTAFKDDSFDEVFIIKDGVLETRSVECGSIGPEYVEITSGLSDGEVVVTSDTKGLQPGMKAEAILEDK